MRPTGSWYKLGELRTRKGKSSSDSRQDFRQFTVKSESVDEFRYADFHAAKEHEWTAYDGLSRVAIVDSVSRREFIFFISSEFLLRN